MEFVKLKFSGVREVVINSCEWKDLQIALKGDRMSYACFEAEEVTAPGSPRKVGEDGALTEDEQATVAMLERWRDKGTMLTNAELLVLKLARPSSAPVGEQK